jgi:hypothetical protein
MKKYLPHKFQASSTDPDDGDGEGEDGEEAEHRERRNGANGGDRQSQQVQQQGGERRPAHRPPSIGGGAGDANGSTTTFRLNSDRVEAMKQAGMWNDPVKRKSMIKRYIEQDRTARQAARQPR